MGGAAGSDTSRRLEEIARASREAALKSRSSYTPPGSITPTRPAVGGVPPSPVRPGPYTPPGSVPPSSAVQSAPTYSPLSEDEHANSGGGGGGGGGGLFGALKSAGSKLGGGITSGAGGLFSIADEITGNLPEEIYGHAQSAVSSVLDGYDYMEREGVQPIGGRLMMTWEGAGLEVPFSEQSRASRWGLRKPSLSRIVSAWTDTSTDDARAYFKQQPAASRFLTELLMFGGPGKAKDIVGGVKMAGSLVKAPINLARFPFEFRAARTFRSEMIGQSLARASDEGISMFEAWKLNARDAGLVNDGLLGPRMSTLTELENATFKPDIWQKVSSAIAQLPGPRQFIIGVNPSGAQLDHLTRTVIAYNRMAEESEVIRTIQIGQGLKIFNKPFSTKNMIIENVTLNEQAIGLAVKEGRLTSDAAKLVREKTIREVIERPQYFNLTQDQTEWVHSARMIIDQVVDEFKIVGGNPHELEFDVAMGDHYFPSVILSRHGIERIASAVKGRSVGGAVSFADRSRVYEFMAESIANNTKFLDDPDLIVESFVGAIQSARNDRLLVNMVARQFGRTPSQLLPAHLSINEIAPQRLTAQWAKKLDFYARQPYSRKPVFKAADERLAAAKKDYEGLADQIQALARTSRKKDARGRLTSAAKQARIDLKDLRTSRVTPIRQATSQTASAAVSARATAMRQITQTRETRAGFFGLKYGDEGVSSEGWIAIGRMDPRRFPALSGTLFPQTTIDRMEATLGSQGSNLARMANQIAGVFRTAGATTDANFPFLQGLLLLGRNPGKWVEATTTAFASLVNPSIRANYLAVQMDKYPATMQRFSTYVRTLAEPEAFAGARPSGLVPQIAKGVTEKIGGSLAGKATLLPGRAVGKTFVHFAGSFDTFLDVARIEWFKAIEPLALARGGYSLNELGSVIRNATGTTSSAGLGVGYTQRQIEGAFLFFAPRYTRSLFAIIFDAMHGGIRGAEARSALGGLALSGAAMYYGVAKSLGQEPDFDPSSPGFMAVRMGDNFVGIGSGYRSLIKMVASSIEAGAEDPRVFIDPRDLNSNPIVRFLRSRTSPTTSTAWDLVTGRDYIGRLTTSDPTAFAEYARGRLLPFTFESYFEANGGMADRAKYLTGSFFFGRAVPVQPTMLRDEQVAKGSYTTVEGKKINDYSSLSTAQRIDFDERNPSFSATVRQQRLERASSFSLLDDANAKKIAALEAAANTYANAGNDPFAGARYRQTRSNILANYRGIYEGLRTGTGLADLEPKTTDQKILAGYFDKVVAPSIGADNQVDFDLQEELDRSYRREVEAKYGVAGVDALDRDLGASGNWLDEQFRADQRALEPYWAHLDQIWIPEVLDQFGLSMASSFPSYESFRNAFLRDVSTQIEGMEVPSALKDKFPTAKLSKQQSGQLALEMFNDLTSDYSDFKTAWRNEYLMDNPDQLSRLIAWSYMTNVPKDLEPYIQ